MSKRILISLLTIGVVLATVGGATIATFTDTESNTGNTFTAGTIDIAVDQKNPWDENSTPYALTDMKPSYTDYIDFEIKNVGSNPADVWKTLANVETFDNVQSEPECVERGGTWNEAGHICSGSYVSKDDIDTVIGYDLSMELYDTTNTMVWHERLYNDDVMISTIKGTKMYLGMIPEGWTMKVHQSYHMADATTNWAQGDRMTFNIVLDANQLVGGTRGASVVLEDKTDTTPTGAWDITEGNGIGGTFRYSAMAPKFEYGFTGVAPVAGISYSLVLYKETWSTPAGSGWPRPVVVLGSAMSNGTGNITIPDGSVELNSNVTNMPVFLVKTSDLVGNTLSGWNPASYLFETGYIEYRDTDL